MPCCQVLSVRQIFTALIIILSGLVRATAVNASRAKRAMMSHYQTYYEERAKSLDSIIDKFKHQTTFEEFVGSVYSPNGQGTIIQGSSSNASVSISNHSRSDMSKLTTEETRPRAHTSNAADHEVVANTKSGITRTQVWKRRDLATFFVSAIMQMQDVSNHHIQLRNRVSVVGIPGTYTQVLQTTIPVS